MEIRKLSEINGDGSYGVTLPKEDLRELEVINEDGQLVGDQFLKIKKEGEKWSVKLV